MEETRFGYVVEIVLEFQMVRVLFGDGSTMLIPLRDMPLGIQLSDRVSVVLQTQIKYILKVL